MPTISADQLMIDPPVGISLHIPSFLLQCLSIYFHGYPGSYIPSCAMLFFSQFTPTRITHIKFLCSKCLLAPLSQLSNSSSRRSVLSRVLCQTLCQRDPRMTRSGLSSTPRNVIIHMKHSTDDLMRCLQRTVAILMAACTISARVNLVSIL